MVSLFRIFHGPEQRFEVTSLPKPVVVHRMAMLTDLSGISPAASVICRHSSNFGSSFHRRTQADFALIQVSSVPHLTEHWKCAPRKGELP